MSPRLLVERAHWDRQVHNHPDHRRALFSDGRLRSVPLLFARFRKPQGPPLHPSHSHLPTRPQIPRVSINPHPSPPVQSGYRPRLALQPDGDADRQAPEFSQSSPSTRWTSAEMKLEDPQSAILSVMGRLVEGIPNVKSLIASRPEPRIRSGFRLGLLRTLTDVFVLHEVEPSVVNADIRLFLEHVGRACEETRRQAG